MTATDPTLDTLLSDPLVLSLMRADRVDPARLRAKLTRIGEDITRRRRERAEQRTIGTCVQAHFSQARIAKARAGWARAGWARATGRGPAEGIW